MNRRQFLQTTATLATAASASWLGYRYLSRPPSITVNKVGLPLAHLLRDQQLNAAPSREHVCETLILGSGAAALSVAWYLARNGYTNFCLADGFERNGNNAAYAYLGSLKTPLTAPSGAHYLAQPSAESSHIRQMLADLGIIEGYDSAGNPVYRDTDLVNAPDERLLINGTWQEGIIPQPHDPDTRRFFALIAQLLHARGSDGRKIFAIPIALSSQDAQWRALDRQTFAEWLAEQGYQSPRLLWYLDYCCRDDYGQGIAHVSAYAGLHYFTARGNEHAPVLTWADGLNHLSEALRRHAQIQSRAQLPDTRELTFKQPESYPYIATQIAEQNDHVRVTLRHVHTGDTRSIRAQNVICAMPLNIAQRIIAHPQRYGFAADFRLPPSAPWLISNFVLHSFPAEPKRSELAWDNIVYGSRGLGYVVASHQHIHVAKPGHTLFTAYTALNHDSPANVRHQLLAAEPRDLLDIAAQDLLAAYGKRFWQHVAHIGITVRAHAMSVPSAGYLTQPTLLALRQHQSRLHFAHSDLSGYSVFEEAAWWGVEAAKRILAQR
ncbi:NAD(P)-binding protein [Kingella oralis]|uniref:NAD(P)-binding protein n=1 Tax=Kingella oralis TaxID=505 RepID=UPI0034E40078